MPQISVIVPVYKVEPYLHRCVDSILGQTFTDFELILVDDGSPDNCPAICDEYAMKDSRVHVIHQENGGLSAARNSGMAVATGEYIMFCDSDDRVSPRWCQVMYETVLKHPTAWIVSNLWRVDAAGECELRANKLTDYDQTMCKSYFEIYKLGLSAYAVNKIYNLARIKKMQLKFDETCFFAEDVAFNVKYCMTCDMNICVGEPLYYYYDNPAGIMRKYYSNYFSLHLPLFSERLSLIRENELTEYCDIWLYQFLKLLENTFDKRNDISFLQRMAYNNKMVKTQEFRYCVAHASGEKEGSKLMRIVRMHNYYALWLFQQVVRIANRLRGRKQ